MKEIFLPELGDGIEKATVAYWHARPGDQISAADDVVEVVTDKATFNIPAGVDGRLTKICVTVGEDARIGSALALVE
ncbi:MAG TPA: lipoyl domain-containing protein [Candidatus Bathyarchaeia archaeon]|nr:lipoyl domain-containing protein [Candidatus Bathyarchaeia archaeon]